MASRRIALSAALRGCSSSSSTAAATTPPRVLRATFATASSPSTLQQAATTTKSRMTTIARPVVVGRGSAAHRGGARSLGVRWSSSDTPPGTKIWSFEEVRLFITRRVSYLPTSYLSHLSPLYTYRPQLTNQPPSPDPSPNQHPPFLFPLLQTPRNPNRRPRALGARADGPDPGRPQRPRRLRARLLPRPARRVRGPVRGPAARPGRVRTRLLLQGGRA